MVYAKARPIQLHGPCRLSLCAVASSVCFCMSVFEVLFSNQRLGNCEIHIEAGMRFIQRCVSFRRGMSVKTQVFRKISEYRCTIFFQI